MAVGSSYYKNPFEDDEPLSVQEQEDLKGKLGTELFKTDSTVSDTGQYNILEETPSFEKYKNSAFKSDPLLQAAQGVEPGSPPVNPDYYVYDRKEAFVKAPFAKNMFGGNLDVAATLDKITFDPYVDGSLRGCIAYIVPWTRTGVSTRTESLPSAQNAPVDSTIPTFLSNFWDNPDAYKDLPDWSIDPSLLGDTSFTDNFVPKWEPDKSIWEAASIAPSFLPPEDFKGKLSTEFYNSYGVDTLNNVDITPSNAQQNQDNLKKDTSVGLRQTAFEAGNLFNKTLLDGSPWSNLVDTELDLFAEVTDTPTGPVFAGNPDGILANIWNGARSIDIPSILGNRSSIPKDLSSKASKSTNLFSSAERSSAAWQFLFNPSQLNLSVGPNFKKSETWGVSDEANSGTPLHWTGNKNAELKFSKVLLNGYVFGKRVEELEQGLIELFMKSPTNDAKHGPRVLEFVWGKKSFGPCVIKDITISEKMWDEGLLVNAEANFTLEKVPEWTINDGYVSTYDASAQETIGTPTKKNPPPSGPDAEEKPATPTPTPDEYKRPEQTDKSTCKKLATAILNSVELLDILEYLAEEAGRSGNPLAGFGIGADITAVDGYERAYSQYSNWLQRVVAADSTTKYSPTKCGREYFRQKRSELSLQPGRINSDEKKAFSKKAILEMRSCINTISKSPIDAYAKGNCQVFETTGGEKYKILG